jgi:hypothetical protein
MTRILPCAVILGLLMLGACANSGLLETESESPDVLGNFTGGGRAVRVEVRHTADWSGTTFNRTFAVNEDSRPVCLSEEGRTWYLIPGYGEQFVSNGWLELSGWKVGPPSDCSGHAG